MAAASSSTGYVEYAGISPRRRFFRGVFAAETDQSAERAVREECRNTDVFRTISVFRAPDRSQPVFCPLFFDIDSADLNQSRAQALLLVSELYRQIGIDPRWIDWRFSGNKGYHVIVPHAVWDGVLPANDIGLWHALARKLRTAGLSCIDVGVYQPARLLRLLNSKNSKSGRYDIPLAFEELRDYDAADHVELAMHARDADCMAAHGTSAQAGQWLYRGRDWHARRLQSQRSMLVHVRDRHGWQTPPCIRVIEREAVLEDGHRHDTYFPMARFYASIGMAVAEIIRRLEEIDQRNPISDSNYIVRVAHNAARYAGFRGCPNDALERFCDPEKCFLHRHDAQSGDKE